AVVRGCGGVGTLGSGRRAFSYPAGDGFRFRLGRAAQPRRIVPVVAGSGPRPFRIRGLGGWAFRRFSGVAGQTVAAGSRWQNSRKLASKPAGRDFIMLKKLCPT